MRTLRIGLAAALVAAVAGCGSSDGGKTDGGKNNAAPAVVQAPSSSAQMVCAAEAQAEILKSLGITTSTPPTSTWTAPVFSCTYTYPAGTMVLSVRELSDAAETTAYFDSVQRGAASSMKLPDLGEGAFAVKDGSVYVRKDFKVLEVDVSKLPDILGQPPISRQTAAARVAYVIMGCWTGD